MEIYFFTIFFLGFFALLEVNLKDVKRSEVLMNTLKFLSFIILVSQMGFRWETGSDWNAYLDHYESFRNEYRWIGYPNQMELGYDFFAHIFYKYAYGYSIFLFVNALIFYLLIFKTLDFFSKYFFITLLVFYCLFMGNLGTNRQLLALALGLYSLTFLFKKQYTYYFLLIFVGYFFHATSLIFIFFFFINRNIKGHFLLALLLISIVIGYSPIPIYIFGLAGGISAEASKKAELYVKAAEKETAVLSIFGLLKRLFFLFVFYIARNKLQEKIPQYNLIFNGYFLGILFYFIFSKSLLVMISRGSLYFNAMEPILMGFLLLLVEDKKKRMILMIPLLIIAIIDFNQSIGAYKDLFDPYKGIFYNVNYRRLMY
ncbi:hypothetical protein J3D55_004007 [Chryseobacterium ginsenosidimutans]|uniref:EpsG family protein n=1 Tax=Chryseobacterium ginsenosidimutans TaxID=687846 RepID=UPI002167DD1E|nr:EpsG family protein [Chryseobacterium ginsenosidimutans]MCS3871091.1 hypothetical protein [Chryseobacterium ginsenosidimutans]